VEASIREYARTAIRVMGRHPDFRLRVRERRESQRSFFTNLVGKFQQWCDLLAIVHVACIHFSSSCKFEYFCSIYSGLTRRFDKARCKYVVYWCQISQVIKRYHIDLLIPVILKGTAFLRMRRVCVSGSNDTCA